MTSRRTYQQYCGFAAALDVLGERWTLLVVRELLIRPRRYGELLADLPGIGTNLLAERLQFLVEKGVIRQTSAGGSGKRQAYELTETGHALRPVVLGLARWGLEFVGDLSPEYVVRPSWAILAVEAMIDPELVTQDEQYEFRIDGEIFHVDIRAGAVRTVAGPAERPALVATTDCATFVRIGGREVSPLAAVLGGKLVLDGEFDVVERACALLGLDPLAAGGSAEVAPAPRRQAAVAR